MKFKPASFRTLILNFIAIFWIGNVDSQKINGLNEKIEKALLSNQSFISINPFQNIQFGMPYSLKDNEGQIQLVQMDLRPNIIQSLIRTAPSEVRLELPIPEGGSYNLLLQRVDLYDESAKLVTESDKLGIPLSQGIFYQGIIENDPESIAAISFFDGEIIGVVSNSVNGNLVIGKKQNLTQDNLPSHVVYYENSLPVKNPFQCAVDELQMNSEGNDHNNLSESVFPNSCKAVKVFLECDYRMFTDRGSSKTQVEIFITGAFNVVKALYAAEKVVIEISEIKVWTTQDPYLKTTLANILFDYANRVKNNFNGTLAQLITTFPIQQQGGIAFVDGMCRSWDPNVGGPHSFAYIFGNYSSLPTYSWIVEVMAHEMGHNFGSWHTHSCVWGPNKNSQIDNCQPPDQGSCNDGKAPVGGGTVMSYCHLTSYGINFSRGFGQEPGDILRNAVSTKACIPASFTPFTSKMLKNPYFEGDSIRLQARPYNNKYQYEWLNYDYIFNKKDTAITIKNTGIYTLAVSNVNCTEYAKPDTITMNDFLVNLGCPVITGKRDSIVREVSIQVDNSAYSTDSLEFPAGLYSQVPTNARDVQVELQMLIAAKSTSFVRSVVSQFESPDTVGIKNDNFIPNETYPFSQRTGFFKRILGNFDPKGKWKFSGIDTRSDAQGFDATVTYKVVISWRLRDSVPPCDLIFCDNRPRLLDAGIPNATYTWTNGSTLKLVNINKEGPIGVTVKRGNFTSSHTVNMVKANTAFSQEHTICEGKKLTVGNKQYDKEGSYIDTFKQVNGCDSILMTNLKIIPIIRTSDTIFRCYNEEYKKVNLRKDTLITETFPGSNSCDSLHSRFIRVNPVINIESSYEKRCNNIGTEIILSASGGKGLLKYLWSDSTSESNLKNVKSGIYKVRIEDESNCLESKSIVVENYDSVSVDSKLSEVRCFGDQNGSIELNILTGTGPFTANWNNGQQGTKLENIKKGKYTVIIIDANSCRLEQTFEILSPDLLFVDGIVKPSFGTNGSIDLTVQGGRLPYKFTWSNNDTTQNINNLLPGTYTVTVVDNNNCGNIQTYEVQNKVGVKNLNSQSEIQITPNPFKDEILFQSSTNEIQNIIIYDLQGKEIQKHRNLTSKNIKVNTVHLSSGYYNIRITDKIGKSITVMVSKS